MRRSGGLFSMSGGLLLAVCFFLPAVKGCGDKPVMPYEIPWASGPYVLGLVACVGAMIRFRGHGVARSVSVLELVVGILTTLSLTFLMHWMLEDVDFKEHRVESILRITLCALAWLCILATVLALRQKSSLDVKAIRARAAGATVSIVWFAIFIDGALYGLWLSIFGAVLLILGAMQEASTAASASEHPAPPGTGFTATAPYP